MRKLVLISVLACIGALLVHLHCPAGAAGALFLSSPFNSPNLVVESIDAPDSARSGHTVPVSNTIRNDIDPGQCEPLESCNAGSFKVRFYLSANEIITTTDTLLDQRIITGLVAGASDFAITNLTITAGIPLGGYYLGAIADANDEVVETDETDNTRYDLITIHGQYYLPIVARNVQQGMHRLYLPLIVKGYGAS